MDNREIIEHFYTSFAQADAEEMGTCYHDDIRFQDPAFGVLKGEDAKNMWRMLVNPGLQLTFDQVSADDHSGSAHWQATYLFSQTGKTVVNNVHATFEFRDGKIIRHTDHFDFWKWSRQALGLPGFLLGWTPYLRGKVRTQALAKLKAFTAGKV